MGARMAPSYANLFMGTLDTKIQDISEKLIVYKRFVDDVFGIFSGTAVEFDSFKCEVNSLHPTINFTFQSSNVSVDFLDTTIYHKNGTYITKLHSKCTDTKQYLDFKSNHAPQ